MQQVMDFFKPILVKLIIFYFSGLLESINLQVSEVSSQVGTTPQDFSPTIFNMVKSISETAVLPIAGMILTFVACYELIQMIMEHNNMSNFDTVIIFKWIFKTSICIYLISNTFNITMGVFDLALQVINSASGVVSGSTSFDPASISDIEAHLNTLDIEVLLGIFLQITILHIGVKVVSLVVFVLVYARMVEIYLRVSLAPVPFATFGNREQSSIGQNYMRSLFAISFQGFLIMVCIGIYAVLIRTISFGTDIVADLWGAFGYMVLLALSIQKSSSIANSIFNTH